MYIHTKYDKKSNKKKEYKIMKTIKIIILFTAITLFTSVSYNAAEARDCSDPKGFHAKMMCKFSSSQSGSSTSTEKSKKKKSKSGESIWKKIKNFGGKNIGEAG